MKYFRLDDDVGIPGRWHLKGPVTVPPSDASMFRRGTQLTFSSPPVVRVRVPGRPIDFTLTDFAVPIAHERLASTMEHCAGNSLERIPVQLEGKPGFDVLNFMTIVTCIDEARSGVLRWTEKDGRPDKLGTCRNVSPMVLIESSIPPNLHAFRPRGWTIVMIVSETMRHAMEAAGCLGARFTELMV